MFVEYLPDSDFSHNLLRQHFCRRHTKHYYTISKGLQIRTRINIVTDSKKFLSLYGALRVRNSLRSRESLEDPVIRIITLARLSKASSCLIPLSIIRKAFEQSRSKYEEQKNSLLRRALCASLSICLPLYNLIVRVENVLAIFLGYRDIVYPFFVTIDWCILILPFTEIYLLTYQPLNRAGSFEATEMFPVRSAELPVATKAIAKYQRRLSAKNFPEILCSLIVNTGASLDLASKKISAQLNLTVNCEKIEAADAELMANAPDISPDDAEIIKQMPTVIYRLQRHYLYASGYLYLKSFSELLKGLERRLKFNGHSSSYVTLAWSPQCFCKGFMPLSSIALGSKAGIITLWSYTYYLVYKIDACRSWIITLEWSRWWTTDDDTSQFGTDVVMIRRSELPDQEEDEINAEKETVLLEGDKREPCFNKMCYQRDKLAMSKMSMLFIWAPTLPVYDNFESVMPITFDFSDTVLIAGISWNNDGTQLSAFSLEGKQWVLDISDFGKLINKAATERLRENVENQLKDAFWKVMVDEKDPENESEDDEGDDEIGSPLPFNIDGLDAYLCFVLTENDELDVGIIETYSNGLALSIENKHLILEASPAYLLWDFLEYADFELHFDGPDNFSNLVQTCERQYTKFSETSLIDYWEQTSGFDILYVCKSALTFLKHLELSSELLSKSEGMKYEHISLIEKQQLNIILKVADY
ncbi:9971_t:CDS:10, partial [Paraglomus occultum]